MRRRVAESTWVRSKLSPWRLRKTGMVLPLALVEVAGSPFASHEVWDTAGDIERLLYWSSTAEDVDGDGLRLWTELIMTSARLNFSLIGSEIAVAGVSLGKATAPLPGLEYEGSP